VLLALLHRTAIQSFSASPFQFDLD
jgi:hypothetical protein